MSEFLFLYRGGESGRSSPEVAQQTIQKWMSWMKDMGAKGHLKDQGHPLERTGKLVKGQKKTVTDGPFAETKEHLAGYYIIDCENLDEAIEWAAKIPTECQGYAGCIEIRPMRWQSKAERESIAAALSSE